MIRAMFWGCIAAAFAVGFTNLKPAMRALFEFSQTAGFVVTGLGLSVIFTLAFVIDRRTPGSR